MSPLRSATLPRLVPAALPAPGLRRLQFPALGTLCALQYACNDDSIGETFAQAALAWVTRFESRYTRFRPDSLVGRINALAGTGEWSETDREMEHMLDVCATLQALTDGLLDATAGPVVQLWNYRQRPARLPAPREIEQARALVGWHRVERCNGGVRLPEKGMSLDFGGWGKEYAVDAVAQLARDHGVSAALIDFGHDVFALGAPPDRSVWTVGVENPEQPGSASSVLALSNRAVAGSGDYCRHLLINGRRYGHIIDPRTGWPVSNGNRQTVVIAPSCLQAGVLATTVFILGAEAGLKLIQETMGVEGRIVTDRAVYQTRGYFHHVLS